MKIIKYRFLSAEIDNEQIFLEKSMGWNDINEETAKREAYKGEYTTEDDGEPDPAEFPTQFDRIEAQVAYTAMMTDTLLEV